MTTILAYIDPGSGMLVWQSAMAGIIGAGFYFRRVFGRLARIGRARKNS